MYKAGEYIKYKFGNDLSELEFLEKRFGVDPNLIKGSVINSFGNFSIYYLINLDISIHGDSVISFHESEIEIDIKRKREETFEKIFN